MRRSRFIVGVLILLIATPGPIVAAQAVAEPQTAAWKPQNTVFHYQGLTTRYSCTGLREKMRRILLALGTRSDPHVTSYSCNRFLPSSILKISMETLQPAQSPERCPRSGKKWT